VLESREAKSARATAIMISESCFAFVPAFPSIQSVDHFGHDLVANIRGPREICRASEDKEMY